MYWLTLSLLVISQALYAFSGKVPPDTYEPQQCDVKGQNYTEITFFMVAPSPNDELFKTNEVYMMNQGETQRQETLWYTGDYNASEDYIFHEPNLKAGEAYQIMLVNEGDGGGTRYYRRSANIEDQSVDKDWQLIATSVKSMKPGNLKVTTEGYIHYLDCSESRSEIEIEYEQCAYFPDSFQSNALSSTNSSAVFSLRGDRTTVSLSTRRKLAFSQITASGSQTGCKYASGEVESCLYDSSLVYEHFPAELAAFSAAGPEAVCIDNCTKQLSPGSYEKIEIGRNGSKITLSEGTYWVNRLVFSGDDAKLNVSGKVILHFNNISFQGARIKINESGDPDNLWLMGHKGSQDFKIAGNTVTINAFLFLDPDGYQKGVIVQADRFHFQGSITASNISVTGYDSSLVGTNLTNCNGNQPASYELVLTPDSGYSLICDDLSPTLTVISGGSLADSFNGSALVTINGISQKVDITDGVANITLLSGGEHQTISVTASLNDYSDVASVSGYYQFVPFKLAVDDQYLIANKPSSVISKALACNDEGGVVDVGYSGRPIISSSWVVPATGAVGNLNYSPTFTNGQSTDDLTLEDAGQMQVTLEDSSFDCSGLEDCPIEGSGTLKGQFTVYSRPWTFAICSPNNAPMNGNISDASSAGFTSAGNAFALNVRPLRWVSTGNDSDPVSGSEAIETSSYCSSPVTQNFFIAGSELSSTVELTHAVAQPSGGADGTLSGTLALSNSEGVSNSYLPFGGLAWSEVGVLRVNADTQASYLGMNVNQGYRDIGRFYPAWVSLISNNWNYSSNHDEFMYMGQSIAYDFVVEAQNMQGGATTNYSSFSPSLIADVKLLAVDTSDDNSEIGSRVEDYDLHFWDGSSQWSGAQLQVSDAPFQFNKLQTTSSPLITRADGPYEDGFGLRVTANSSGVKADGVDFKTSEAPNLELNSSGVTLDTGKPFSAQPDIRYGRMVLDDVGGTSTSTIYIPLRTEYWNGSRFIENEQDSGSTFVSLGGYVCQQTVWSGSGSASSASLQGADSAVAVKNGVSNKLSAKPHSNMDASSLREQIRFWLRMSDTSPQLSEMNVSCGTSYTNQPWLQYNWRDRGDEDPSAVVTFGVYRGNDRIIFRGESGLTGQ
ncbi:DUF6701 domain-containing protein [Vibrio diazotrophicus]|uniref:DUF6701 domain-containing protein n=1 Tax=Vibrio diazotrophicus TaxID=685 RepID=UPI002155E7B8|nr:DUF6701 domain-containing protein [Vibrio diazotrophicus]